MKIKYFVLLIILISLNSIFCADHKVSVEILPQSIVDEIKDLNYQSCEEYFFNNKARANARSKTGKSALQYALRKCFYSLVEILIDAGANLDALSDASEHILFSVFNPYVGIYEINNKNEILSDQDIIIAILDLFNKKGININNLRDKRDRTLLFCAVSKNLVQVAEFLIDKGANILDKNLRHFNGGITVADLVEIKLKHDKTKDFASMINLLNRVALLNIQQTIMNVIHS